MNRQHSQKPEIDCQTIVQTLVREHQELARILNALAKLSVMQSTPLTEPEWQQVLERKALLLDEIALRNIDVLSAKTKQLAHELSLSGRQRDAEYILGLAEANRQRLSEIQLTEDAAQQILEFQIDDLRQLLTKVGKGKQAKHAYQYALPQNNHDPRFLDDIQ